MYLRLINCWPCFEAWEIWLVIYSRRVFRVSPDTVQRFHAEEGAVLKVGGTTPS